MPKKENWEIYSEGIASIARSSVRRWMVGTEIEDIEQELWIEYLRLSKEPLSRIKILKELKRYSKSFVRIESENKFLLQSFSYHLIDSKHREERDRHWKYIQHLWEGFLKKLSRKSATILRLTSQGCTTSTIATTLGVSKHTIKNTRPMLIKLFKKEVEENIRRH